MPRPALVPHQVLADPRGRTQGGGLHSSELAEQALLLLLKLNYHWWF